MEQQSPEWFAARCGKVTASRLADVMARTKSGYSASRQNYMAELICQRLTGTREEGYSNSAMRRGNELEPVAREMYVLNQFDAEVSEVGFIPHPVIEGFGASPDGLVNDDGLIEIKCPNTWTHLETIKSGNPKRQYLLQFLCEVAGTMPVHIIAEKLERSPRAVCLKARYIGVRINPPHWNDEEISLITSGKFSNEEIAEKTGRSIPAISIKRLRLRNKSGVKCCTTSRLSFSKPNPYRKYINEFENNANYLSGICLCCHDDFCLF